MGLWFHVTARRPTEKLRTSLFFPLTQWIAVPGMHNDMGGKTAIAVFLVIWTSGPVLLLTT